MVGIVAVSLTNIFDTISIPDNSTDQVILLNFSSFDDEFFGFSGKLTFEDALHSCLRNIRKKFELTIKKTKLLIFKFKFYNFSKAKLKSAKSINCGINKDQDTIYLSFTNIIL